MSPSAAPDATILIPTRNRLAFTRRAVASALAQEGDVEVLVVDDASDDGSAQALAAEFPEASVHPDERRRGAISQRNRGARLARGRILVAMDDDAELPSPHTVAQTLALFDHERVGAVTIPLLQPAHGDALFQAAPDASAIWCTFPFIAAAAAVRRDLWLAAGGFRANPVPRVEEGELLLRLLDGGFVCRLGTADPAVHHEAGDRDMGALWRQDFHNEVVHAWWYAPGRDLPLRLAGVAAHALALGVRHRRPGPFLGGVAGGVRSIASERNARAPIARGAWRAAIRASRAPVRLDELEAQLPAPDPSRLAARARGHAAA